MEIKQIVRYIRIRSLRDGLLRCARNDNKAAGSVIAIGLYSFLSLVICSCNPHEKNTQADTKAKDTSAVIVPEFNADSAYAFVQKQVDFGPRIPNTPAQENALPGFMES